MHTPGPWHVRLTSKIPTAVEDQKYSSAICQFPWTIRRSKGVCVNEANANLIAAAPDLLEACHGAIAHLVSGDLTEAMTLKRLREAIAKAEGKF